MSIQTKPNDVVESLNWRYATKKFDPAQKISPEIWSQIEAALMLTPSSFGLQPWKFIVVTDQSIKERLPTISFSQRQPADCSHLVVICRLNEMSGEYINQYVDYMAQTRNLPLEAVAEIRQRMLGFIDSRTPEQLAAWMEKQCYIALGNLMTTASMLGVDNCPMEGLNADEYDKVLGLEKLGCHAIALCALGFRANDDRYGALAKVRFPASDKVIKI